MQPKGVISTIGYQGTDFVAFRSTLRDAGVRTVIDVRAVALSRRPEFTGRALAAGLSETGIAYVHLPDLGNPPEGRAAAAEGQGEAFMEIYRRHLESAGARAALAEAARIAGPGAACLMCMERDAQSCHRRMTAVAVAELCGLKVRHLVVPVDPRQGSLFGN